jgi:carboxyl-terminal processing protease
VMGTQSFGMGSVQTIMPMAENAALKLTTSRYYTPSGRSIQALGITPDIMVEEPGPSTWIREVDLKRHLENDRSKKAIEPAPAPSAKTSTESVALQKQIEFGSKEDFQLMQAIAHLKGEPVQPQAAKVVAEKQADN